MHGIDLHKLTGLYCCLLLFFNIIMRNRFGMCVSISLNGSISVIIAQGGDNHNTLGK